MSVEEKTEVSRRFWNEFAEDFASFDGVMEQIWSTLLRHLELGSSSRILEIGAGRGSCSRVILNHVAPSTTMVSTDLSEHMVSAAKEKFTKDELQHRIEIKVMNALDLSGLKDGSFDRYIANMTLQIVADPEKMLREARRVLKDGSIAAFSVWGDPKRSTMMSLRENGEASSNFNFGRDLDLVRKRFHEAGFKQVVMWRQQTILELWNAKQAVDFWAKAEHKSEQHDPEWYHKLLANYQAVIDRGEPIGLEALIILART